MIILIQVAQQRESSTYWRRYHAFTMSQCERSANMDVMKLKIICKPWESLQMQRSGGLPEDTKDTVVEVYKPNVSCRDPNIKNVNNELLATCWSNTDWIQRECIKDNMQSVGIYLQFEGVQSRLANIRSTDILLTDGPQLIDLFSQPSNLDMKFVM